MNTYEIERNLESVIAKYKGKQVGFGETRIDYLADDCLRTIRALQAECGWISVNDRLPEENTAVLCVNRHGQVHEALCIHDGELLYFGEIVDYTHWKPLPRPPKDGE